MTSENYHDARVVLERIVRMASNYDRIQGSSSMEVAASIVSYLTSHLQEIPDFMMGRAAPGGWPPDWRTSGDLSWRGPVGGECNPGEDIRSGRAAGAVSESVAIASWLRGKAAEYRRSSLHEGYSLAVRLEYEIKAKVLEGAAGDIDNGMHRSPVGRAMS